MKTVRRPTRAHKQQANTATRPTGLLQRKADASSSVQKVRQLKAQVKTASPASAILQPVTVTLLASYSDGKIGSIYFEKSRLRGPHPTGPKETEDETSKGPTIHHFSVEIVAATKGYQAKDEKYLRVATATVAPLPPADQSVTHEKEL